MTYATLYPTRAAAEAAAAAYAQSIRAQAPADARLCLIEATARGGAARTVRLFAYLQSPAS